MSEKNENKGTVKYYTSGEFARRARVTLRTIRYYDKQNILKPSKRTESGSRLYTDEDFALLQQILLLKYLGFSLDDIREMTIGAHDKHFLLESLKMQKLLVLQRAEEMQSMANAIDSTMTALQEDSEMDWDNMLDLIHMTAMEDSLEGQYRTSSNISARIQLHRDYSVNPQGWFPWVYEQCGIQDGMRILEIGCGNGEMWIENQNQLPSHVNVVLSDISDGMVKEVHRTFLNDKRFSCRQFDGAKIPYADESFDMVIANHVLFYCEDLEQTLFEIRRVLKKNGIIAASTYGKSHMVEITELVQSFNEEIVLAKDHLFEIFGLENGAAILQKFFADVECRKYEDGIVINEPDPLISYILSCHGNQNRLLLDRYKEFKDFVTSYTEKGFHITKDAGIFLAKKL